MAAGLSDAAAKAVAFYLARQRPDGRLWLGRITATLIVELPAK